jgi:hypothetical protein
LPGHGDLSSVFNGSDRFPTKECSTLRHFTSTLCILQILNGSQMILMGDNPPDPEPPGL